MPTRDVEIQWREFQPEDIKTLFLEEGERVLGVESGTRFSPTFRVWIEVPAALAKRRRERHDQEGGA